MISTYNYINTYSADDKTLLNTERKERQRQIQYVLTVNTHKETRRGGGGRVEGGLPIQVAWLEMGEEVEVGGKGKGQTPGMMGKAFPLQKPNCLFGTAQDDQLTHPHQRGRSQSNVSLC